MKNRLEGFMRSRTEAVFCLSSSIKANWSQQSHWTFLFVSQSTSTQVCFHFQMNSISEPLQCGNAADPASVWELWGCFSGKQKDKENGVKTLVWMEMASVLKWMWPRQRFADKQTGVLRGDSDWTETPHRPLTADSSLFLCVGPEYRHRKHLSLTSERALLEEGGTKSPRQNSQ